MADKTNKLATAQPKNPRFHSGTKQRTVDYASSDITSDNSAVDDKFVLAGPFRLSDRISAIRPGGAGTPELTSASDNDLGFFYKKDDGTLVVLDADILWDGVTLVDALTHPNLLTALNTSLDVSKNIGQHLGMGADKEPAGGVYLVLTTNVANTATGPLTLQLFVDVDEATTS